MYWITGFLGVALLIAPFLFGYSNEPVAAWTSFLTGITVTLISLVEGIRSDEDRWEYWTAEVLGIVMIAAPFILGFSWHATAMWTSVTIGVLLALMAGSRLYVGKS